MCPKTRMAAQACIYSWLQAHNSLTAYSIPPCIIARRPGTHSQPWITLCTACHNWGLALPATSVLKGMKDYVAPSSSLLLLIVFCNSDRLCQPSVACTTCSLCHPYNTCITSSSPNCAVCLLL
jgi:hypothetical protein